MYICSSKQYNSKYLGSADLGIQGTYKYDPGHYHVYTTDNSAETGSSHSNKPSDENSFEETISYGNTRWSRRKVLVVAVIICLLGVVVLGAIAGIVIAVVENNNGKLYVDECLTRILILAFIISNSHSFSTHLRGKRG